MTTIEVRHFGAALPIVAAYAVVLWLSAAANDGIPLLAVVIFAGPQLLLFWLIRALDSRP